MKPLITPSLDEFLQLAKQGNVLPVFAEFVGDSETPVSAFKKVNRSATASFLNRQKRMTHRADSHLSDSIRESLFKVTGGKSASRETALRSGSARLPILSMRSAN